MKERADRVQALMAAAGGGSRHRSQMMTPDRLDPAPLARLTPEELAELDTLLAVVAPLLWQPLPGPPM